MQQRPMNFMTVSSFWDLHNRGLLDMDPPYQRRSVWNQDFKDYFIDTVLNGYPAPAIFLFRYISPDGISSYSVVDGKQRLTTLFEFASNQFPVWDRPVRNLLSGKYFKDLDNQTKTDFWTYQFAVEYIPNTDEQAINNIFDRINRNMARLSSQELRHARFSGDFITEAESLTEWMFKQLPSNFPNLAVQSRRQMKEVEFTAQLLLLIEEGPKSYSQLSLDEAFAERDTSWDDKEETETKFRQVIGDIHALTTGLDGGDIRYTRFRNQADFYSLFGGIHQLLQNGNMFDSRGAAIRLLDFIQVVESPEMRAIQPEARTYYEAARSASNDAGSRKMRIDIIESVLSGKLQISDLDK